MSDLLSLLWEQAMSLLDTIGKIYTAGIALQWLHLKLSSPVQTVFFLCFSSLIVLKASLKDKLHSARHKRKSMRRILRRKLLAAPKWFHSPLRRTKIKFRLWRIGRKLDSLRRKHDSFCNELRRERKAAVN